MYLSTFLLIRWYFSGPIFSGIFQALYLVVFFNVVSQCRAREIPPNVETSRAAQEWTNRTLINHERTSVHFLVLPGSLLSSTEITEYTYISLI